MQINLRPLSRGRNLILNRKEEASKPGFTCPISLMELAGGEARKKNQKNLQIGGGNREGEGAPGEKRITGLERK